ncbi:MAG: asparagine synthase (glutamine-hydrolyzing) [Bacteroidetes bacterium]|nr:asparagine synthase (glutamine-hydrolyzing) [Bacteroidota bacterium]
MCGIAGYYTNGVLQNNINLAQQIDLLSHRGPNSNGHFKENKVGLVHTRLSIIDLSANANQPMYSQDERYVIVFNGEVYNHRELGAELKSNYSINLKTHSDTEVILEGYVHEGVKFIDKLNGMFAFAIYDRKEETLFICRDRVGIKPLFYYWDGYDFIFASEIKAIVKVLNKKLTINKSAVYNFLHLGFIPNPDSIYQKIKKLKAGHSLKINKQQLEISPYWNLNTIIKPIAIKDEKKALVQLSDLLMSSVQYHLKSDVPYGVFLSGGIDSSLVTSMAVALSGSKINTFSIGFTESKYNESNYAKKIATHLNTNHHEFIVSYKDALELVEEVTAIYDEPFADSSFIPTMLVSKLSKEHVTVTLSGEGGDELFMGYGSYIWAKRLNNPFINKFRHQLKPFIKYIVKNPKAFDLLRFIDNEDIPNNILSQEQQYFLQKDLLEHIHPDFSDRYYFDKNIYKKINRTLTSNERQVLFDLNYYLQDDLLCKVDRASMCFGLETRVPLLDHRLIEYSLNIHPDLKYRNGVTKYILKEILYQYIPKEFFNRPKQGFAIPLEIWLKNELSFLIEKYLSNKIITKYNIVSYKWVSELIHFFRNGKPELYNKLWLLIVLHMWLEKNENNYTIT